MGGVMLPVFLDLSRVPVLLIGRGDALENRLHLLGEDARHIVHAERFDPAQAATMQMVMIAGLPEEEARRVAAEARKMGKIVHLEDDIPFCDFFLASTVKRGDLTLAVGTGGKSPALARLIRRYLEQVFDARWETWSARISEAREGWKMAGDTPAEITAKTQAMIHAENMEPLSSNQ